MTDSEACQPSCSLSRTALRSRRSMIAALLRQTLQPPEVVPGGRRLHFPASAALGAQLERLIALEAECCPFLTLTAQTSAGQLSLTITGPPEAQAQLAELWRES